MYNNTEKRPEREPALRSLTADEYPVGLEIIKTDPLIQARLEVSDSFYGEFTPRPDAPEEFDQQWSFCLNQDRGLSCFIGGNAAGTTEAAAFKAAKFVLQRQPPPRADTPFWIASNTYEQVCDVCWKEKLLGHGHIPSCEVQWDRVAWKSAKLGQPLAVPLKPWPGRPRKNWVLEMKSFEQGRTALQGKSIGGFWFSEQFPLDRLTETIRGCREYWYPGSMFAEFTPIDPYLCTYLEDLMDDVPRGWAFYRANTVKNIPNLADGWFESFFAAVPEEMRETRMTGALATFEGAIYPTFARQIHVVEHPDTLLDIPDGVFHYRGIDWGASEEHPFVCLWGYRDGLGEWTIYDEYWSASQTVITLDHIRKIVEISERWGWPGEWIKYEDMPQSWKARRADIGPIYKSGESCHHVAGFADPSRPDLLEEFSARGLPISPAANAVYKGIDCVRTLLKVQPNGRPRLRIHARCKHLIEEMRRYRWRRGRKPTEGTFLNPAVAAPQPLKRDDDSVDAERYMLYSVERDGGEVPGSMSHREYAKRRKAVQLKRS